jgi:hypothetical protein
MMDSIVASTNSHFVDFHAIFSFEQSFLHQLLSATYTERFARHLSFQSLL